MASSMRIIVTGLIGQYPLGGVAWDYLQYLIGLARLGHDVYYLEDSGQWPYNPSQPQVDTDCGYNVEYLREAMSRFGFEDRWAYRVGWPLAWAGLSDRHREEVVASADLLLNVSGSLGCPEEYRGARRMAYLDSDPVFTQVKLAGQEQFRRLLDLHDVQFSFGERMTDRIPDTGYEWRPTRQPVVLSEWSAASSRREVFTTVMNWTSYKPVTHNGYTYGQKDIEFRRFLDLPRLVHPTALEIAVAPGKTRRPPRELLAHRGWRVVDPNIECRDLDSYRAYIERSMGEWSVAKNGYVVGQPGWFSCRSACYLAAGRPVVVQDTGFSGIVPVGEGVLTFQEPEEAVAGIREVERNYAVHSRAALDIAHEYFDSDKVLSRLVEEAMNEQQPDATRELPHENTRSRMVQL